MVLVPGPLSRSGFLSRSLATAGLPRFLITLITFLHDYQRSFSYWLPSVNISFHVCIFVTSSSINPGGALPSSRDSWLALFSFLHLYPGEFPAVLAALSLDLFCYSFRLLFALTPVYRHVLFVPLLHSSIRFLHITLSLVFTIVVLLHVLSLSFVYLLYHSFFSLVMTGLTSGSLFL